MRERGDEESAAFRPDIKPFIESSRSRMAGVKRLVTYYQEGGPPGCNNEDSDSPALALGYGIDALPRKEQELRPRIGDDLWICVLGVRGHKRIRVEIEAPGMDPESLPIRNETEAGIAYASVTLLPENLPGQWRLTAHAGSKDAEAAVGVLPPAGPGYRHAETHSNGGVDFLVVGLDQRQPFALHIYKPVDIPSESSEELPRASYLATVEARANGTGHRIVTLDSEGAGEGCYLAKLEVNGRFLDDRHNELSVFCPTVEAEAKREAQP